MQRTRWDVETTPEEYERPRVVYSSPDRNAAETFLALVEQTEAQERERDIGVEDDLLFAWHGSGHSTLRITETVFEDGPVPGDVRVVYRADFDPGAARRCGIAAADGMPGTRADSPDEIEIVREIRVPDGSGWRTLPGASWPFRRNDPDLGAIVVEGPDASGVRACLRLLHDREAALAKKVRTAAVNAQPSAGPPPF